MSESHVPRAPDHRPRRASPAGPAELESPRDRLLRGPVWGGAALRSMEPDEIDAFLRLGFWGVLATVEADGRPFASPVAYAWDGASLFLAVGTGRQAGNLLRDARAVLNVVEVSQGSGWWSVIVEGRVEPVERYDAQVEAWEAIRSQRERTSSVSVEEADRSILIRIEPEALSGRVSA